MLIKDRIFKLIAAISLMAVLLIGGTRVYAADIPPVLVKATVKANKITITWEKVPGAGHYIVYFHKCDGKPLTENVDTLGSGKTSYTSTVIDPKKDYKFCIVAEKKVKGKFTLLAKSRTMHIASIYNKTYTNPRSVTVKPGSILAYTGDTVSVKAKVNKVSQKKSLLGKGHGKEIQWYSSNPAVATVNGNGLIKALKAGKCKIYAVALNGKTAKIPVTVRALEEQKEEVPTVDSKYTVTYKYIGKVPSGAPAVPAEKSYAAGASVKKQTVPSLKGYTFSGWNGEVTTMPEKDIVVSGFWTKKEYKLTFKYTDPNTKKDKSTVVRYNYGDKVSAIADPAVRGYKFDSWKNLPKTMPDKDVTVTGSFKKLCKVTVAVFRNPYNIGEFTDETIYSNDYALYEKVEFEVEEGTMSYQDALKKLKKTYPAIMGNEVSINYWYVENSDLYDDQRVTSSDFSIEFYIAIGEAYSILYGSSSETYENLGIPEPPEKLVELLQYTSDEINNMGADDYNKLVNEYDNQWFEEIADAVLKKISNNSEIINKDVTLIGWLGSGYD